MKVIFSTIFFLMFLGSNINSQTIFTYEDKVINFRVPRDSKCYEGRFLKITPLDTVSIIDKYGLGLSWNPIDTDEIVGCNVNYVGKYKISSNKFDTLYKSKTSSILELSANKSNVYIVVSPNELLRFEKYQLLKVDLKTNSVEEIKINSPINVANICVSNDNRYLAFISRQNIEKKDLEKHYLMIFDLLDFKITTIDSSSLKNDEYYCSSDDNSVLFWINDNKGLLYLKHNQKNNFNSIYKYDLTTLLSSKLTDIPFDRVKCFSYYNGDFYSIVGGQIQKYNKNRVIEQIYKVSYKFDYLFDFIYMMNH